jgi:hypothetical protein
MGGFNKISFNHEEIIRLYNEGFSIEEISGVLPFSYGEIQSFLKSKKLIKPKTKRNISPELIVEVYKSNNSVFQTTRETGVHSNMVYGILRKNGFLKSQYKFRGNIYPSKTEMTVAKNKFSSEVGSCILKGYTKEQLMKKFQISKATAAQYLKGHTVKKNKS